MQQLTLCTLTGADDATDLNRMADLSERHPFAEWGVLYSARRAGSGRYPSMERIQQIVRMSRKMGMQISLHICGSAVYSLLSGDPEVASLAAGFHRLQINLSTNDPEFDLGALSSLVARCRRPVITQHNEVNAGISAQIMASNHEVLFDSSGGRGIESAPPHYLQQKRHCGYSGGLSPDNLARRLPAIATATGGRPFWIDMEASLRTNDEFDLAKAEAVLSAIEAMRRGS